MEKKVTLSSNSIDFAVLEGKEIVSLRGNAAKHFDLGAGRVQAITYSERVHYPENGVYLDIDNRLIMDEKTGKYHTTKDIYTTELTGKDEGGEIVSLVRDGVRFGWKYPGNGKGSAAQIVPHEKPEYKTEQEKRADLSETLHAEVKYADIREGMDVVVHIGGNGIKDDIVLKTKETLPYAGIILPEGFEYMPQNNGGLTVLHDGKEYICISAPCAWDAKGNEVKVKATLDERKLRYDLETGNAEYPITIDPLVSYSDLTNGMEATHVLDTAPNTNYGQASFIRCGKSGSNVFAGLIKPTSLIEQTASDTIISAQLYVRTNAYGSSYEYFGTYPINCPWTPTTATWNTVVPHIGNSITSYIDNTGISDPPNYQWNMFDITEHYRAWYKKDNNGNHSCNGVALKWVTGGFYVEFTGVLSSYGKPYIAVNYVSHAGRKGWWKYESMGNGRAGSVYTDLYNGNLIAEHVDTATAGSRMPVSVSHVYNSCLSGEDSCFCGRGWRLNVCHSLRKETIVGKDFYIWQDGDGTNHYFEVSGNQPYSDSEGMQLKLAVNTNDITITDKSETVMLFPLINADETVYITSTTDAQGNRMLFSYDSTIPGKLVSITDGIDRNTVFAYNVNGLLSTVTAPGCPVVSYSYSGNAADGWLLTRVDYSDLDGTGKYTSYEYDTYGGTKMTATLIGLTNIDGTVLSVLYDTDLDNEYIDAFGEESRRVVSMELANGTAKGARKKITYGHMHTRVKFITGTADDSVGKEMVYHFNHAGNVVSTHDEMWHGLGAEYDSGIENTPSATSSLIKSVINRLTHVDFYSGWTVVKTYGSDDCTRSTSVLCMGMASEEMKKKGVGELISKIDVRLFRSGMHTFSAYLKTNGLTAGSGCKGAFLRVIANGETYESRASVSATTESGSATFYEGWERLNVTFPFELSQTDTEVSVQLVCDASAGTAYWSCPQVEEGSLANHFNMVSDGDFSLTAQETGRTMPEAWTVRGSGATASSMTGITADRSENHLPDEVSGNAMRFGSKPNQGDVYIAQDISVIGFKRDIYTVSGWCSAESVASGSTNFEPRIGIRFYDVTDKHVGWTAWQYIPFSKERSGWHCLSAQISAYPVVYSYMRVQIGVFYSKNDNTAMFTHISLNRELYGNSYTFDDNGNIIAVKDATNQQSAATYDSFDNLLSYIKPGSASTEKYLFTYGSTDDEKKRHLPLTATTPEGVKTATTYDSYGNTLTNTIQENATSPLIRTETEYTANGNFVTKQKDARGNEVTNTLDGNGKVLSVTDPAGQSVGYTYDASNRVTKVETAYTQDGQSRVSKNEYTYEDDRISTVSHNTTDNDTCDVQYKFHYDALGRKTSVTVSNGSDGAAEQALSTNVYSADRKSRLEEVQYGNGGKVSYTYDEFDRVTGVTHDDDTDPKFTYEYDAKGRVAVVTDTRDGSTIRNIYDLTDRPTESEQRDGDGNLKYRTLINYDIKNRVKSFTEATATETKKTEYTYDADDRVTEVKYNGSDSSKVSYTYDKLNRITNRTVTNGTTYSTAYTYVPGSSTYGANATTPLVATITQGSGADAMNFAYTYDNRGNITSETRNGVITTYEYDALGQLTRVNDPNDPTGSTFGTTWIYSYDRGGNILNKSAYVYTTGTVGTVVRSWAYGYDDPNWKDKLTSFDGHAITYDAIGNPLNDGEWTYEWQAGRQLKRMTNLTTGVVMEFTYNHEGIRTKKVKKENGVAVETTEYILNGKQVEGLFHTDHTTNTTDELQFFYDAQGRVSMLKYEDALYSYEHNLQGDIIGILDGNGELVVEFLYDEWGKTVRATGSMASTLGEINSFRYREYVWDQETKQYYLTNRYYSPVHGIFLNPDVIYYDNVFSYCNRNPVINYDIEGLACVCCFDENGNITTFMKKIMCGGAGGSMSMGTACIVMLEKEKFLTLTKDIVVLGVGSWISGGTFALGTAFASEAKIQGFGYLVGAFLKGITIANGVLLSEMIETGLEEIMGIAKEKDSSFDEGFAIDYMKEIIPIEIPWWIELMGSIIAEDIKNYID